MAIIIKTTSPQKLLAAIKEGINEDNIRTWSYDSDGDFTHTPEQWQNQAWLRPQILAGELRFGILENKNKKLSKSIYGVYHGRFIEMLLTHFDTQFSIAEATAQKSSPDKFS
ncbi:MAG: hypothetical protein K0R59_1230 [Sphingobacterium sp.]|jgi:hypothetical protein|nr:hypothetical protein [Sphingobacterium sp.]